MQIDAWGLLVIGFYILLRHGFKWYLAFRFGAIVRAIREKGEKKLAEMQTLRYDDDENG